MSSSDESDSFSSVQADFERLMETVQEFSKELDLVGNHLTKLQAPIEKLCIDQLHDTDFLASSTFRSGSFQVKAPGFPGVDVGKRYPYSTICAALRTYIFRSNSVSADGTIHMNDVLQSAFQIDKATTTFPELLENLTRIVA